MRKWLLVVVQAKVQDQKEVQRNGKAKIGGISLKGKKEQLDDKTFPEAIQSVSK